MRRSASLSLLVILVLLVTACTSKTEETTTPSTSTVPTTTTTTRPAVLTDVGVGDGTITLAALLPLSGTLESFGRSVQSGHEVYWAYVNDTLGGVGGSYAVEVVPLDTGYDEEVTRSLWAANEKGTLAVSSVLGSPITAALLEEVDNDPVLIAAGSQAAGWSGSPNIVLDLAIPTYRDQIAGAIVAGGTEEPALRTDPPLGLIYQIGPFGDDCLAGFDQATDRLAPGEAVSAGHAAGTTDFADPLGLMRGAGVDTLFVCSSSQALLRIVATLDLLEYSPTVVASSQSYDASIPAALGDQAGEEAGLELLSDVYLVGSLPSFEGDSPGMKLLRDNYSSYFTRLPDEVINPWFFLGYTQAATFHLILEEALDDGDLTREGLLAARDRLDEVDFGFGSGPARYDENRVPVVADALSVPASSTESLFGMTPISGYYSTR